MKKTVIVCGLIMMMSCTPEETDCRLKRLEIIERVDEQIRLENGNQLQIDLLERSKQAQLNALNC